MTPVDRESREREIRALCQEGRRDLAAELALRGYGPEIYGFLLSQHRDEQDAAEIFALFSERLWLGLGGFSWDCSLRTWAYAIARNTGVDFLRRRRVRGKNEQPADSAVLRRVVQEVRSQTEAYRRTENKARIAALRETLPAEDQALLTLRLDRGLEWRDLARVMLGAESPPEAALKKEAARLRKRFQLVKERLIELARSEGLLGGEGGEGGEGG